jgi:hypothetical protein
MWCDGNELLPYYLATYPEFSPKVAFRVLGEIWIRCDRIGEYREELEDGPFTSADTLTCWEMMNPAERRAFRALPDEFVVWRGCYANNKEGLSWSIHRNVAEGFPFLHRFRHETKRPLLIKGLVRRSSVIALKLDRSEAEIITRRPEILSITTARDSGGRFKWVAKEGRIVDAGD